MSQVKGGAAKENILRVLHQAKKHPRKLCLEVNRLLGRQVRPHIQLLQTKDGEISDSWDIAEAANEELSTFIASSSLSAQSMVSGRHL